MMIETYLKTGGRLHTRADCKETKKQGGPKNCCIHRPSEHPLMGSAMNLRAGKLIERICEHGIGHPDPDSREYLAWDEGSDYGVHGCDGCCRA